MNKIEKNDAVIYNFASIGELIETAEKSKYQAGINGSRKTWVFDSDPEADSREKTYSLLKIGKGLSSIRKLSKKYREEFANSDFSEIMNRVKSIKRVRRFNDFDGNLDLDRVMSGDPCYWEKTSREGKVKVVRIGINFCLSWGNSIKDFSRMVALSAVFAEILESMGYGVEVYGASMFQMMSMAKKKTGAEWCGILFPVKAVNEPLDFDRIYSLGLPGLLRDVQFRVEEHLHGRDSHGGRCTPPPPDVLNASEVDVIVEKSWTDGKQVEQIVQAIESL